MPDSKFEDSLSTVFEEVVPWLIHSVMDSKLMHIVLFEHVFYGICGKTGIQTLMAQSNAEEINSCFQLYFT